MGNAATKKGDPAENGTSLNMFLLLSFIHQADSGQIRITSNTTTADSDNW